MTSVAVARFQSGICGYRKVLLRSNANNSLTTPLSDGLRANFANDHCALECRYSTARSRQSHSEAGQKDARETSAVRMRVSHPNIKPTVQQSSAIYFKRHKGSRCRAALFRQLRASSANQTRDVKQQTFGSGYIAQGLQSGQLLLRGFAS